MDTLDQEMLQTAQAYQMKLQLQTSTKALTAVGLNEACKHGADAPKNGANIMARSTQAHR